MMASQNETAPVSYTITAKAAGLLALRKKFKNAPETLGVNGITIGDLVGYALVKTLLKHPTFNSHLEGGVFTKFENVHLAVAVDTPRGLLVPVVRGASAMNLKQFSAASKAAANGAIDGSISPDLLSGGTFTVSNLGSFGVETFTPVINRPQCAILGVAAITPRPVALPDVRKKFKNAPEDLGVSGITIGDLVGYALVKTLLKHPTFNSHLEGGVFTKFENVHLAVAVDTPRGLLVPVVRGASAMNLKQFSAASKAAANGAIDGTISPDLLSGGTFTVSNLGSFGVETFTPVINRPQSAILGVAAITPRPVALPDGTVGVEQRIGFSLTADHQVIDGADAARFLRDLVSAIENIDITVLG